MTIPYVNPCEREAEWVQKPLPHELAGEERVEARSKPSGEDRTVPWDFAENLTENARKAFLLGLVHELFANPTPQPEGTTEDVAAVEGGRS